MKHKIKKHKDINPESVKMLILRYMWRNYIIVPIMSEKHLNYLLVSFSFEKNGADSI